MNTNREGKQISVQSVAQKQLLHLPANANLTGFHVEHVGSTGISGREIIIFNVSHCVFLK